MDIPFDLKFIETKNGKKYFNNIVDFTDSLESLMNNKENYINEVSELIDLEIYFNSENKYLKFKIEFLDILPENEFKSDEDYFFTPDDNNRTIYMNDSRNGHNYTSLIPGDYIIEVSENDNKFMTFLKVNPKNVDFNQLNSMKEEIETVIKGLSKEISLKRNAVVKESELDILGKIAFFSSVSQEIIFYLMKIKKDPKFQIEKNYFVTIDKGKNNDLYTQKMNQYIGKPSKKVSFRREISFDNNLNQGILYIADYFSKEIQYLIKYLQEKLRLLKTEYEIQKRYKNNNFDINSEINKFEIMKEKLNKVLKTLNLFVSSDQLQNLKKSGKNLQLLSRYSNYRILSKFYFLYTNNDFYDKLNGFSRYHYIYKESSKLYEIWGFIKILMLIKNSKYEFQEVKGWIFDGDGDKDFPILKQGETIVFTSKNSLKLILKYDAFIPRGVNKISDDTEPLFTIRENNRPDFRIDIYKEELFKGSIIGDFKYRPLNNIGNLNTYLNNHVYNSGFKVYKQLLNYSSAQSYFLNSKVKKRTPKSAVERVFCFYPVVQNKTQFKIDENTCIIRYSLSPDEQNLNELEQIQQEIYKIIDDLE